jgi:hypothetical protein
MKKESKVQYEQFREIDYGKEVIVQNVDDLQEEVEEVSRLMEYNNKEQERLEAGGDIEYDEEHQVLHSFDDLEQDWDNEYDQEEGRQEMIMSMAERGQELLFGGHRKKKTKKNKKKI